MGPVTPLIAVAKAWQRMDPSAEFFWAVTPQGPEVEVLASAGFRFYPIPVVKFPRYLSLQWFQWPFQYWRALKVSEKMIAELRPDLIVSAGGFTAVPVMRTARALNIPCVIHQLDREPGMTNKMTARFATMVTSSFTMGNVFGRPVEVVPTPNRYVGKMAADRKNAAAHFQLSGTRPVMMVVGGGTGARALNEFVAHQAENMIRFADIIHVFGTPERYVIGVDQGGLVRKSFLNEEEMFLALSAVDIIVSRAGMGAVSDFAALQKTAILVPITGSSQEANARAMPYPMVLEGEKLNERILDLVQTLLANPGERERIGAEASHMLQTDDGSTLAQMWKSILK